MATYKVPQDVEADDKLIGPFSFRQFIYLIIVALAIALAWGLAQIFIGLAVIPLPVILFFGVLALPLRKDQPMEIYIAAIISFHLKPRKRLWDSEGVESLIEISAPKTIEVQRTKDLSQGEANQRLSYLADIVDSQGWAIRGVAGATGTAMNSDIYLEAQSAEDILDTNTAAAHNFDQMMAQSTERMREEARDRMMQATVEPAPVTPAAPVAPVVPATQTAPASPVAPTIPAAPSLVEAAIPTPEFNPYPTFNQSVLQPVSSEDHYVPSAYAPPASEVVSTKTDQNSVTTSDSALSTGIMNLANNPDLSIETIAREAKRLEKKALQDSEEVVISLR